MRLWMRALFYMGVVGGAWLLLLPLHDGNALHGRKGMMRMVQVVLATMRGKHF
jgi:hypothetical protein